LFNSNICYRNTWEKAVYHLLVQYRAKKLENYTQDDSLQNKRHTKTSSIPQVDKEEKTRPLVASNVWNEAQSIPDLGVNKLERAQRRPTGPGETLSPPVDIEPVAPKDPVKTIKLIEAVLKTNNTRLPDSPQLPPIPVSTTGDNTMTNLLAQISGLASNTQRLPRLDQELPPLPDIEDAEDDRFADAEEDDTYIPECIPLKGNLNTSRCGVISFPNELSPKQPGVGLGISATARQRQTAYIRPVNPPTDVKRRPFSLRNPKAHDSQEPSNRWDISSSRVYPLIAQPMNRRGGTFSDKENTSTSSSNASHSTSGTVDTKATSISPINESEKKQTVTDRHVKILLPEEVSRLRRKHNQSGKLSCIAVQSANPLVP
jgi:hypothetical protein